LDYVGEPTSPLLPDCDLPPTLGGIQAVIWTDPSRLPSDRQRHGRARDADLILSHPGGWHSIVGTPWPVHLIRSHHPRSFDRAHGRDRWKGSWPIETRFAGLIASTFYACQRTGTDQDMVQRVDRSRCAPETEFAHQCRGWGDIPIAFTFVA